MNLWNVKHESRDTTCKLQDDRKNNISKVESEERKTITDAETKSFNNMCESHQHFNSVAHIPAHSEDCSPQPEGRSIEEQCKQYSERIWRRRRAWDGLVELGKQEFTARCEYVEKSEDIMEALCDPEVWFDFGGR